MVVVATLTGSAVVAEAKVTPPTAIELAKKLVKSGICANPRKVDAQGSQVECDETGPYSYQGKIDVFAFATKKAMLRSLDQERIANCRSFGSSASTYYHPQYRVGPTWWTHTYRELTSPMIERSIGGKVQQFGCA